jgi:hypothetical protein
VPVVAGRARSYGGGVTSSPASSSSGAPGLDLPEVTVAPGDTATTGLTVRNDSDIVQVSINCDFWTETVSLHASEIQNVYL